MADPETPAPAPCPPIIHELVDRFHAQIDALDYERYGLGDDEIRIVEEPTR